MRHTPALTRRRSNSALPLGEAGARDLSVVEDFYARRGARVLVQIAPAQAHAALDAELAARGWSTEGSTDVLVADAGAVLARTPSADVAIVPQPDRRWVTTWAACERARDAEAHAREVLARIEPEAGYALAPGGLGVGLAVCERGWAGLFCMATAEHARRRGVASAVVHALTRWATERGAQRIYLLAESTNAAAHGLYASAGFTRSHTYHYRVAPGR